MYQDKNSTGVQVGEGKEGGREGGVGPEIKNIVVMILFLYALHSIRNSTDKKQIINQTIFPLETWQHTVTNVHLAKDFMFGFKGG